MLEQLQLHNFRTYLNAKIAFTNRHLLIGRNNSGKTNLCTALRFISASASSDLSAAALVIPGWTSEIKNWAFDSNLVDLSCRCLLPFEGESLLYTYSLQLTIETPAVQAQAGQTIIRVSMEKLAVRGPSFGDAVLLMNDGKEVTLFNEGDFANSRDSHTVTTLAPPDATMLSKLYEVDSNRRATLFRRYLSSWAYFSLSPSAMRTGWRTRCTAPGGLAPLGENLGVVLYHMKNTNDRLYRRVIEHVRLVEPDLEAINFVVTPGQPPVPFVELRGQPEASWEGLSDGTLRCLALAWIVEAAGVPGNLGQKVPFPLAIIEEAENGVYPGQLRAVFDIFEERAPESQFIFTSHSPYFINLFDAYRKSVTYLRRANERTEVLSVPPEDDDPDRLLLAEQYSMGLLD